MTPTHAETSPIIPAPDSLQQQPPAFDDVLDPTGGTDTTDAEQSSDPAPIYQAERIVRHRMRNGTPQFLIKWLGFPASHNTWEPRENLLDGRLLKDYFRRNPAAQRRLHDDPDYRPCIAALSYSFHRAPYIMALQSTARKLVPPVPTVPPVSRQIRALQAEPLLHVDQPTVSSSNTSEAWLDGATPLPALPNPF